MNAPCANYREQRRLFCDLFNSDNPLRILFFRGKSGCGKTTLLRTCLEKDLPNSIHPISFDFKNLIGVDEFLDRVMDDLGQETMPHFAKEVMSLQQSSQEVGLEGVHQKGTGNLINVHLALQSSNPEERTQRRKHLARVWFDDLRNAPPIIFVMDTYEEAGEEVRKWVEGFFLERARRTPNMYVLIAGQKTPDHYNIEWGPCCAEQDLPGVHAAEDWLPVARELHRRVPSVDWLAGVCIGSKGQPDAILAIIKSLPYEEDVK